MTLLLVQNLVKIIGNMLSEKVLKNNILALAKKAQLANVLEPDSQTHEGLYYSF